MLDISIIGAIKAQLQKPLPGHNAQMKMAPAHREHLLTLTSNKKAKEACVLCLLYPKHDVWHIALTRRTSNNKRDKHSGQISFPGGKYETTDKSYAEGALRETEEEIGVSANSIQVLGAMTPMYIPISNFQVYPFVGFIDYLPLFKLEQQEVQEIIEVPLSLLLDKNARQQMDMTIRNHRLEDVPYFNVFNKVVWGATAMMLSEFVEILEKAMMINAYKC